MVFILTTIAMEVHVKVFAKSSSNSVNAISALVFFVSAIGLPDSSRAIDLSAYEEICSELGLTKRTEKFGACVMELHSRNSGPQSASKGAIDSDRLAKRNTQNKTDADPDDLTCQRYGFVAGSPEYSQCRLQIDFARKQAAEQQRQYEQQITEQRRAQDRAHGEAMLRLGLGLMGGGRVAPSTPQTLIQPPNPTRIYNLPGGKFMTCTTTGLVTNCM